VVAAGRREQNVVGATIPEGKTMFFIGKIRKFPIARAM
jgi:hypothetical protein